MPAALAFPGVPIVHFCHGWLPWEETPLRHRSIRRYVAVDDVCVDRLVREEGIAPSRVDRVLNFVDLVRFQPRAPLPSRPGRALVFSNQATGDGYCRAIATACAPHDIVLDVVGHARGNAASAPETLLPSYDIVFAKARSALEAMAVGCAVVLADVAGCGTLVTSTNFDRMRGNNFGIRELSHPHDERWYADQIAAVSADDAAAVRDRVRAEAGLDAAVDRLLAIYASAMREPALEGSPLLAAASHLQWIAVPFKKSSAVSMRVQALSSDLDLARRERDDLASRLRELEDTRIRDEAVLRALPTLRIRDAILRVPIVGPLVQTTARRLASLLDD
jgi:hypothetical protein